ncbi:EAL domain-containing protein, partial [Roseivivax isoporae]
FSGEQVSSAELVGKTLEKLNGAGVRIAPDDFGTGYASLFHLRNYPVDVVKIDRSFVQGIGSGKGNRAIISAVIGLSESFGVQVVAEGIETKEQADFLRQAGCMVGQGFLFFSPVAAKRVPGLMDELPARQVMPTSFSSNTVSLVDKSSPGDGAGLSALRNDGTRVSRR